MTQSGHWNFIDKIPNREKSTRFDLDVISREHHYLRCFRNMNWKRRMQKVFVQISAVIFAISASVIFLMDNGSAQEQPNIVVMVMDNLGWGEIGVYGGG